MQQLLILALLISGLSGAALAEQTLLSGEITHGGYGGPAVKFTQFDGNFAVLAGGQAGWIVNHVFAIGMAGYGLATNHHPRSVPSGFPWDVDQTRTDMGYGGAMISYIGMSDRLLHPTFDLLVGGGSLRGRRNTAYWNDDDREHYDSDAFFVVEPTVNAELNLLTFMRFNAGIGYRLVSGVREWGFTNGDVSGISASAAIKFGRF